MMKPMEDSKDEKLFVDQKSVTTNNQVRETNEDVEGCRRC